MQAVALEHALMLSAILFCLGLCGLLMRRNILFILMSLEVMMASDVYFNINLGRRRSLHWPCPITATVPPFSYHGY